MHPHKHPDGMKKIYSLFTPTLIGSEHQIKDIPRSFLSYNIIRSYYVTGLPKAMRCILHVGLIQLYLSYLLYVFLMVILKHWDRYITMPPIKYYRFEIQITFIFSRKPTEM